MPQKPFVSAQEVAERAGVSRSAVSRTFTPGASVSPETRRRVVEAAEALGYHVNHLARGLMRNESGIVCLIVSEMSTPYRANLIRAMTQQLQNAGKVAMRLPVKTRCLNYWKLVENGRAPNRAGARITRISDAARDRAAAATSAAGLGYRFELLNPGSKPQWREFPGGCRVKGAP